MNIPHVEPVTTSAKELGNQQDEVNDTERGVVDTEPQQTSTPKAEPGATPTKDANTPAAAEEQIHDEGPVAKYEPNTQRDQATFAAGARVQQSSSSKAAKMIEGWYSLTTYDRQGWAMVKSIWDNKASRILPSDPEFDILMDWATTKDHFPSVTAVCQKIDREGRIRADVEVKEEFEEKDKFLNLTRPSNVIAVLIQQYGDTLDPVCNYCQRNAGIFEQTEDRVTRCVVLEGVMHGCCVQQRRDALL